MLVDTNMFYYTLCPPSQYLLSFSRFFCSSPISVTTEVVSRRLPAWARRQSLLKSTNSLTTTRKPLNNNDRNSSPPSTVPKMIQLARKLAAANATATFQDKHLDEIMQTQDAEQTTEGTDHVVGKVATDAISSGGVSSHVQRRSHRESQWRYVCDYLVSHRYSFLSSHLAEALRCCAICGFRHEALGKVVAEALQHRGEVRSVAIALLAMHKLKLPLFSLHSSFIRQLSTNPTLLLSLSFADLRLSLLSLTKLSSPPSSLFTDILDGILVRCFQFEKFGSRMQCLPRQGNRGASSRRHSGRRPVQEEDGVGGYVDSRDLLVVPYCVGAIGGGHEQLLSYCVHKMRGLYLSRVRCLPLDALHCLQGLTALGDAYANSAKICERYCRFLLSEVTTAELLVICNSMPRAQAKPVWRVWNDEILSRVSELSQHQLQSVSSICKAVGDAQQLQQVLHHRQQRRSLQDRTDEANRDEAKDEIEDDYTPAEV
eukprot:GHVS01091100.1.p1 GENE.GHVS01091100.1~~GHVS01091100.1.p1  ORF type:complete len:485 (+),score=66.50 GHVS01091100.1:150-1604(+)